jgi:hypothetical protein
LRVIFLMKALPDGRAQLFGWEAGDTLQVVVDQRFRPNSSGRTQIQQMNLVNFFVGFLHSPASPDK